MKARIAILVGALVLAAACGEGDVTPGIESPTPTPTLTPTPTPTATPTATPSGTPVQVSIAGIAGPLHEGRAALFRMKSAGAPTVCEWVRAEDGDPWGFVITSAGLAEQGRLYDVVELVLNAESNLTWDSGVDHAFRHAPVLVGTTMLSLTFTHDDLSAGGWTDGGTEIAVPPGFTWTNGLGCPGDP